MHFNQMVNSDECPVKKKGLVCCTCSINDITAVCSAAAKENHDKPQPV